MQQGKLSLVLPSLQRVMVSIEVGGGGSGGVRTLPAVVSVDGEFPLECHCYVLILFEDYVTSYLTKLGCEI